MLQLSCSEPQQQSHRRLPLPSQVFDRPENDPTLMIPFFLVQCLPSVVSCAVVGVVKLWPLPSSRQGVIGTSWRTCIGNLPGWRWKFIESSNDRRHYLLQTTRRRSQPRSWRCWLCTLPGCSNAPGAPACHHALFLGADSVSWWNTSSHHGGAPQAQRRA